MTQTSPECGTIAGHQRHRNRGVIPCEPCRKAYLEYQADYNTKRQSQAEIKRQARQDRLIAQMYVMERLTIARNKERERYATKILES